MRKVWERNWNRFKADPWRKTWDALVWILVIFPFLTGGIWFRTPGLFIELAELGAPVLFVTLTGFLVWKLKKVNLTKASSVRLTRKAWEFWKRELTEQPPRTLAIAWFLISLIWSMSSLARHVGF